MARSRSGLGTTRFSGQRATSWCISRLDNSGCNCALDVGQTQVKTLTKLGAILDVAGQWMVLSRVCPRLKVLRRSAAGHLLVDWTNDWMVSGKPLPDVQTPEPVLRLTHPTETAHMVQGEGGAVTDLYASEVMVCGLEDEGQVQVLEGDGNQVTQEYIVFSSNPEDAEHEATIVRQKKIPSKKGPDQMSTTPGHKARKAEETEDLEYQERSE